MVAGQIRGNNMSEQHHLSTTALARVLGKEPKEVFSLLAWAHWMVKVDERWQLTEKGRFEGGIYLQHPKFGDYVAWPESVQGHAIWRDLPEAPLTVSQLGGKLGLPARLLNLLLAERGWQQKAAKGWLLTEDGHALGGQQHRAEDSYIPFVTWPERLEQEPRLLAAIHRLRQGEALDGRPLKDANHGRVANWLFLHGISFAVQWGQGLPLPISFYLPGPRIAIQLWEPADGAAAIKQRLAMEQWLKHRPAITLEAVEADDLGRLDQWLPGQLLRAGLVT